MKLVNHNSSKPIIVGVILGLVLSVILCFTQNIDLMFYFSGAPYYIDSLILGSEGIVSIITFIYFIGLFGLIGYLSSLNLKRIQFVLICVVILVVHLILLKFAGDSVFSWMKS